MTRTLVFTLGLVAGCVTGLFVYGERKLTEYVYLHEALLISHSVAPAGGNSTTGVRWYELRNLSTTPTLFQQGTYPPDATYRWRTYRASPAASSRPASRP